MPTNVLQEFADFFDGAPESVRRDLSGLLMALAYDGAVDVEGDVLHDDPVRGLFNGQTHVGKIGDLINAVGVVDVYFALDTAERFRPAGRPPGAALERRKAPAAVLAAYADRLAAVETARRAWLALRAERLSTGAIAVALRTSNGTGGQPSTAAS